jgi:hypothetical protein
MICSYAALDTGKLDEIQALEKKLGKVLIAFSCRDVNADTLSESEMAQLKEVEEKLGVALLAVR